MCSVKVRGQEDTDWINLYLGIWTLKTKSRVPSRDLLKIPGSLWSGIYFVFYFRIFIISDNVEMNSFSNEKIYIFTIRLAS